MPAGAIVVADPPNADFPQPSAIEIYECVGRPTEYVLSYGIDIADGTLPLLEDAAVGPDTILSVIAEVDDVQDCLVKGPVFAQSIKIAHGGEGSSVLVVGGDTRIAMDRASKAKVYPEGTDSDAVQSVFGPYHLTPDVVPTDGHYSEETHALVQRETDFELVQRLARQNGFLFWITAGVDGVETGHFKPPVLAGEPAAQLAINQADSNTITELAIDWNVHTATATRSTDRAPNRRSSRSGRPRSPASSPSRTAASSRCRPTTSARSWATATVCCWSRRSSSPRDARRRRRSPRRSCARTRSWRSSAPARATAACTTAPRCATRSPTRSTRWISRS